MMLVNEDRLRSYLENSPKAKLWINKLGMEKALKLSKTIFVPLGIVMSLIFIGVGVYGLLTL
jgi:hypothetical protein